MTEKNVNNKSVNIAYRRSRRARRLRITIAPTRAVTVTVPVRMSMERAEAFVRSKQAWIQKHLEKMRTVEASPAAATRLSEEELVAAQQRLFARLEHFAAHYNLPYNRAAFRCQKTRWGSCSSYDNISLNINIAFLPAHLQDYILLHELCHIRHKNHSGAFWAQLEEYCNGRARQYAKELRSHRMNIQTGD